MCLYRLLEVVAIKGRSRLDKLSYSKTRIHLLGNITEAYSGCILFEFGNRNLEFGSVVIGTKKKKIVANSMIGYA